MSLHPAGPFLKLWQYPFAHSWLPCQDPQAGSGGVIASRSLQTMWHCACANCRVKLAHTQPCPQGQEEPVQAVLVQDLRLL